VQLHSDGPLRGPSAFRAILRRVPSYYRDASAPPPNRPVRIGALALVERDGMLLVERRAEDGTWGLVGGALEEDETIVQALRREVREETALSIRAAELFGIFSDPSRIVGYRDGNVYRVLAIVFRVEVGEGDPVASEESYELRFVARAELEALDLTPAHRPIVERYLAPARGVVVE
jgi:ADP-ribose pyrophosphatase YjhB (NUDIX family)